MTKQKMQPVRGTKDLYGEAVNSFNHIVKTAKDIGSFYGFSELATPIFEFSEIYERNLGESSDIISKEVYKFPDRGDNFLTLRPEFTAGIVRSFISNGEFAHNLPQKFFSYGPIFRYDRPQKGRQRQFHQINFELIGSGHFLSDVEAITLANKILSDLGVLDQVSLHINSLGCETTRDAYQTALVEYLSQFKDQLSQDSQNRLENNPLRILDSKDKGDQAIIANAPQIGEFYSPEAKESLENILSYLDKAGIKYHVNPTLVRGLDYYTGMVFEFITNSEGAQNAVLAGGRYDKLISKMGGGDVSAIGFAGGVERLMLLLEAAGKKFEAARPVSIIYISENELEYCVSLLNKLRNAKIYAEISYGANFKKQMKKATNNNAKFVIIIGEEEVKSGKFKVKDFDSGEEMEMDEKNVNRSNMALLFLSLEDNNQKKPSSKVGTREEDKSGNQPKVTGYKG